MTVLFPMPHDRHDQRIHIPATARGPMDEPLSKADICPLGFRPAVFARLPFDVGYKREAEFLASPTEFQQRGRDLFVVNLLVRHFFILQWAISTARARASSSVAPRAVKLPMPTISTIYFGGPYRP